MKQGNRVIIVGAGIGGLCAALAMAKQGMNVTVCEKSSQLGEVGAGLQISPNAFKVLRALGLESVLSSAAFVPQNASMRHFKTGAYYLQVPLAEHAVARYGAPYWHLHRADLHRALADACVNDGVALIPDASVESYEENFESNHVKVLLRGGRELESDFLIGADGVHSTIRAQMLGPEQADFMGQVAWRGVVPVSELSVDIKPDACVWVGPNRHFVSYYLRGGEYVNFVAVEERSDWSSESWREEGDVEVLKREFAGWHPEVTALISTVERSFLWALNGRKELSAWHQGRVALLGDACHPMLPFMAQGAAMAIEDAYVLAMCMANDQSPASFVQYEQERKPRTTKIQAMSKANADLYHMKGVLGGCKLKALQLASQFVPDVIQSKLDAVYGHDVTKR